MTNETEPRVPALLPCPNEECRGECRVDTAEFSRVWQVFCERNCGYSGPAAATADEAIALHNRMPRTEQWVSVAERMPETKVVVQCWVNDHWQPLALFTGEYWRTVENRELLIQPTHWRPHTPPRGPVSR